MKAIDWNHRLSGFVAEYRQLTPLQPSGSDLIVGKSDLCESPQFLAHFLSYVAEQTGAFVSFEEFLQRFEKGPLRPSLEKPDLSGATSATAALLTSKLTEYEVAQVLYRQWAEEHNRFVQAYIKSLDGYLKYLSTQPNAAGLAEFIAKVHGIPLVEVRRALHTYACGMTGSGKSELLKSLIYHYAVETDHSAVIVFDPHGDLVQQVRRWPEFLQTTGSSISIPASRRIIAR